MIKKKVPGAGEVHMVYDLRDRLILSQDDNLRTAGKWLYTKYDALNRPISNGLLTNSSTIDTHQASATSSTDLSYPSVSGAEELITYTYDKYPSLDAKFNFSAPATDRQLTGTAFPYPVEINSTTKSTNTKGKLLVTKVKVLGTTTYLSSVNYYDEDGRVVQTVAENFAGGMDRTSTQYSWNGNPVSIIKKQENKISTPQQDIETVDRISYDHLWRNTKVENKTAFSKVSGGAMPGVFKTISVSTYDGIGKLNLKKLGSSPDVPGTELSKILYQYNIRGWLLSINKALVETDTDDKSFFGMGLNYDIADAGAQYNGNISQTRWRTIGDHVERKYAFTYDKVNRLTAAAFGQKAPGASTYSSSYMDFSVDNLTYDANGNIMSMRQKGFWINGSGVIDNMTYSYLNGSLLSNKLRKVTDASPALPLVPGDFKDGYTGASNDYEYDGNGNLKSDLNKNISQIQYNHLNLPATITITAKGSIQYLYDATGKKLRKIVTDNTIAGKTVTTTTNYLDGLVYETKSISVADPSVTTYDNQLQFISNAEGRVRYVDVNGTGTLEYDYFLKDHLGNVRMVLTEEKKTNYYPAATLEGTFSASGQTQANSMVNHEKKFYKIDPTKIVTETSIASWGTESTANTKLYYNNNGNPPANTSYPSGSTPTQTAGSTNLYRLNATTNKIGLEFGIKVMAGDKVDIFGKSYFLNTTQVSNANSTTLVVADIFSALMGSPENLAGQKGLTAADLSTINNATVPAGFIRGNNGETGTTVPKAYINYIILDEQFKVVSSGSSRVGSSGTVNNHWNTDASLQAISIQKNGYIFVYVSNESNFDVYFDNLQIVHAPGRVLEETHYYPFGLTMAGISSRAMGKLENRIKYNGSELQSKEFTEGSGLELYDFNARTYDQQVGRFIQIDPLTDEGGQETLSPYHFSYNNPVRFSDPDGKMACCSLDDLKEFAKDVVRTGTMIVGGAVNAWGSNQVLGAGRVDVDNMSGLTDSDKKYAKLGQAVGDGLAVLTGVGEVVVAGGAEVATLGGATPAAVAVGAHGVSSAVMGMSNLVKSSSNGNSGSNSRSGKSFTPKEKQKVVNENKAKNNGNTVCENCGVNTTKPEKSKKGVTPPKTDTQVDHKVPESKGGSGTADNGQILCRDCNIKKSNN